MKKIGKILLYGVLGTVIMGMIMFLIVKYTEFVTTLLLVLGMVVPMGLIIYDIVDGE